MTAEGFRSAAMQAGVLEMFAMVLSDTDAAVVKGALFDDSGDLAQLTGRPTTPFRTTITEFVQNQHPAEQAPSHV